MCDECTWHHNTFVVQSVYWHLAIKLYRIIVLCVCVCTCARARCELLNRCRRHVDFWPWSIKANMGDPHPLPHKTKNVKKQTNKQKTSKEEKEEVEEEEVEVEEEEEERETDREPKTNKSYIQHQTSWYELQVIWQSNSRMYHGSQHCNKIRLMRVNVFA